MMRQLCHEKTFSQQHRGPTPFTHHTRRAPVHRRRRERCPFRARALEGQQGGDEPSSGVAASPVASASSALADLMQHLQEPKSSQHLMDWIPDAALDVFIEARKRSGKDVSSVDIADFCAFHNSAPEGTMEFSMDSHAQRLLVWDTPQSATPLSAMTLESEKSVHRISVTSQCGEEVVLTATVEKQESLQAQYRSSPRVERTWRLCNISGESALDPGDVVGPSPCVGPELVVSAQLQALAQHNASRVFSFASPENQAITGPVERFEQMLYAPQFRPLLGHTQCQSLKRVMSSRNNYLELVAVTVQLPTPGQKQTQPHHWLYLWDVQRKAGGAWMTNSVHLLSASNTAV